MAIQASDFTADSRRGWGFHFNKDNQFTTWELDLKDFLERQGIEYNKQRLELDEPRRLKIEQIRQTLRGATDVQIAAALAALGLS